MIGIVDYGFYLPKYKISVEEIAKVWGKRKEDIESSLNVKEKTVSGLDEDSLTMAYEASSMALKNFPEREKIKTVLFGSETHPYAVNPASTILAEFLGIEGNYLAYDTEFACKAGTSAAISAFGLIKSGFTDYALVAASDKATGQPHDSLEYTAASGAVSLLLGKKNLVLEIIDYGSFSSDTPDFWRREGIRYPSHSGRFTGKPSYFHHVESATKNILKKNNLTPAEFKYAVFHMPNGKFPINISASLGFNYKQVEASLVAPILGNSYTASGLMGLVSVLETAKENDLIFFCSYGSGAGSDAFIFKVTAQLKNKRKKLASTLKDKKYLNYTQYLKFMNAI